MLKQLNLVKNLWRIAVLILLKLSLFKRHGRITQYFYKTTHNKTVLIKKLHQYNCIFALVSKLFN
jgi:hypothetical protein